MIHNKTPLLIVAFAIIPVMIMGYTHCNCTLFHNGIKHKFNEELSQVNALRNKSQNNNVIAIEAVKLFSIDRVVHPDSLYKQQHAILSDHFLGESGQDLYCAWYAYIIAQSNKDPHYHVDYEAVSRLFLCVKEMLRTVSSGGSGFGHESYRIPAYVSYYIYTYNKQMALPNNKISSKEIEEIVDTLWQLISIYNEDVPIRKLAEKFKYVDHVTEYLKSLVFNPMYLYCLQNYMESYVPKETYTGSKNN